MKRKRTAVIKVEVSQNYTKPLPDSITALIPSTNLSVSSDDTISESSALSSLFDAVYSDESVRSFVKDEDRANEKEHFVSVLLTGDEEIQALNKEYRGIDSPTDVLSFPQNDATLLGDIVISIDTLLRNASELHISVEEEFRRLLVHSFLHLLGYDHATNDFNSEEMLVLQEHLLANYV